MIWIQEGGREYTEDEGSVQNDSYTRAAEVNPSHTMTVAHTRRNANGTIGSVYSGNKIRHLKKDDGIPLWRKDIQFSFLRAVFEDPTPVFTKASDHTRGHTFADIYIDAMARSSKTSKILKDKLLSDRLAALNMAMVCLLVNVGRMNTTLNFFPEMRAQLRTYHSIPSLQAHQDPNSYKQLQDAPRLKSILKGASEDSHQPSTIEKIKAFQVPRTNPVNLIFVLSQYAPKISETHFFPPRDFFDLVMRATLSSRSRAKAFLWLIWYYLESDFSGHAAENNPFGRGLHGDATGGLPLKVPAFEHLTEEQANAENVDTEQEKEYGEMKRLERKRILEVDESIGPPMKKGKKSQMFGNDNIGLTISSDTDRTPSPSPIDERRFRSLKLDPNRRTLGVGGIIEDSPEDPYWAAKAAEESALLKNPASAPLRPPVFKTRMDQRPDASTPAPPGISHPILHAGNSNGVISQRRPRPETSHQKAVNINRKMRIEHILHRQLLSHHSSIRKRKKKDSSSFGFTAMKRIKDLPDGYDTDDEQAWGPGGLVPNPDEMEDFGEEALRQRKSIDRAVRRLIRDDIGGPLERLVKGIRKRKRKASEGYAEVSNRSGGAASSGGTAGGPGTRSRGRGEERGARKRNKHHHQNNNRESRNGGPTRRDRSEGERRDEGLDDLDLDLLGESRDDDHDDEMEEESGMEIDSEGEGDEGTEEEL